MDKQALNGSADTRPILSGMRVIEYSAFIAAPLSGLVMSQLGADVLRIDPLGGNIDASRWPVTKDGLSLYWCSLNRGKEYVQLDLRSDAGKQSLRALIRTSGPAGHIFVTSLPLDADISYEALSAEFPELIMVQLSGSPDGAPALDYTVNAAIGFPLVTGGGTAPVNHVLPAWDVSAGMFLVVAILAAERRRQETGIGQLVKLSLSDVAMSLTSDLGYLAEAALTPDMRSADGNYLYGGYGDAFKTLDERWVMVVAISDRQWQALIRAIGLEQDLTAAAAALGYSLRNEGDRYQARELISAFLRPWFARKTMHEIECALDKRSVLWSPYRTFTQLLSEDPRCSVQNPMFHLINNPRLGEWLVAGTPLSFSRAGRVAPGLAPAMDATENTSRA